MRNSYSHIPGRRHHLALTSSLVTALYTSCVGFPDLWMGMRMTLEGGGWLRTSPHDLKCKNIMLNWLHSVEHRLSWPPKTSPVFAMCILVDSSIQFWRTFYRWCRLLKSEWYKQEQPQPRSDRLMAVKVQTAILGFTRKWCLVLQKNYIRCRPHTSNLFLYRAYLTKNGEEICFSPFFIYDS
jgi:hypothetical protein